MTSSYSNQNELYLIYYAALVLYYTAIPYSYFHASSYYYKFPIMSERFSLFRLNYSIKTRSIIDYREDLFISN